VIIVGVYAAPCRAVMKILLSYHVTYRRRNIEAIAICVSDGVATVTMRMIRGDSITLRCSTQRF